MVDRLGYFEFRGRDIVVAVRREEKRATFIQRHLCFVGLEGPATLEGSATFEGPATGLSSLLRVAAFGELVRLRIRKFNNGAHPRFRHLLPFFPSLVPFAFAPTLRALDVECVVRTFGSPSEPSSGNLRLAFASNGQVPRLSNSTSSSSPDYYGYQLGQWSVEPNPFRFENGIGVGRPSYPGFIVSTQPFSYFY